MAEQQTPELFSVALSKGGKFTAGFRGLPVTTADWDKIKSFLELLKDSVVVDVVAEAAPDSSTPPPIGTGNAARILHGHVPTESELARASERIALRDNIKWAASTMEDGRLQAIREKRDSTNSSNE